MMPIADTNRTIRYKHWIIFFIMVAVMLLYRFTNRPIGEVRNLTMAYDLRIPLVKEFIVIYNSWYPFVLGIILTFMAKEKTLFVESAMAVILGNIMALLTFILFQTIVPRPSITGSDIFSKLILMTYGVDNPYNGFPSLHVIVTVIVVIAMFRSKKKRVYKVASLLFGILILLSTLFVKQHVLLDVFSGIIYGVVVYIIAAFAMQFRTIRKLLL